MDEGDCFVKRSSSASSSDLRQQTVIGEAAKSCLNKNRKVLKVALLGSAGVGKRALIREFISEEPENEMNNGELFYTKCEAHQTVKRRLFSPVQISEWRKINNFHIIAIITTTIIAIINQLYCYYHNDNDNDNDNVYLI